jgi:PQQ-like domain
MCYDWDRTVLDDSQEGVDQMSLRWHHALVILSAASFLVVTLPVPSSAAATQLWAKRYTSKGDNYDVAYSIGVSPDGARVFVTGVSSSASGILDYETVSYDASTGAWLWAKRYDGPGHGADFALSLDVSPDGAQVFVTGQSLGGSGHYDFATIAYDASTGTQIWARRYNGPAGRDDIAWSVAVSPDSTRVYVTGGSAGSPGNDDYATVAYDASGGSQLWVKRYNGQGNASDVAFSLAIGPDGSRVYVTGGSTGSSSFDDYATIAYDASSGSQLWLKRYNGPANSFDDAYSLAVGSDGARVFVTGASPGPSTSSDYATIAYDASTGAPLWTKRYSGPAKDYDTAVSVGVSPDATMVFVTGTSIGFSSSYDYATIGYDAATGHQVWAKRYNGEARGSDFASSLAVSPDGDQVFVTGESWGSSSDFDYATIAYDASAGSQLWAKRYNGQGKARDDALAIVASPAAEEVFVTGESAGSTTFLDYATVAYSTG